MPPGVPDPTEITIPKRRLAWITLGSLIVGGAVGWFSGQHNGELIGTERGYQAGYQAATPVSVYVSKQLRPCKNPDVITIDPAGRHHIFLEDKGAYTRSDISDQQKRDELERRTVQFLSSQQGYKPAL